jgi:hypothetical protein
MVNPRERLNDIRDRAASARDRVAEARAELESELDTFSESTSTQRTVNYDTSQDVFDSKRAAERRAAELGISGSHKVGDDQYRPGRTAGEYQQAIGRVVEEIEQGDRRHARQLSPASVSRDWASPATTAMKHRASISRDWARPLIRTAISVMSASSTRMKTIVMTSYREMIFYEVAPRRCWRHRLADRNRRVGGAGPDTRRERPRRHVRCVLDALGRSASSHRIG